MNGHVVPVQNDNMQTYISGHNNWGLDARLNPFFHRYGGLSVGGQLPILDVDPEEILNILSQLGRIMNITGVW